ncbi:hypothetical protein BDF22DRAFT_738137 [Syncephalis plumigaleata]|nr:hypothetical protein BDF22DRAFT_738137 [Syncephalis plumigaleata]
MLYKTRLLGVALAMLSISTIVTSHMQMHTPIPRGDPRNKEYGEFSYRLDAPLNGRKNPGKFPCRYQKEGPITAQYTAGKNFTVEFMQGSPHMGGHCQFAMSYDNGKNWVVLRTILTMCFAGKAPYQYSVALPKGARNGRALFGWAFINGGGQLDWPELLVARLPGTIDIPRWANEDAAELDGRKHFADRKIVTIPVDATPSENGTVVGEWGGGKEGVERPPAVIPWGNFIDNNLV